MPEDADRRFPEPDPGPPLPELADYGLPTSSSFVEDVDTRIDRHETAVCSAELPLVGFMEVVRSYFMLFLEMFSPSAPRE